MRLRLLVWGCLGVLVVAGVVVAAGKRRPQGAAATAAVLKAPAAGEPLYVLRQTGGPGSLVEAVPAKPDPPSKRFDPHYVAVVLDPETAADEDEELAGLVASELRKVKPVNPGRAQTFGALDRPRSELRRVGWNLAVRRVWAVPGGWRALVLVSPQVRGGDGRLVGIANVHREEWTFVGGQLELAAEEADRSAAAGFTGMR